MQLIAVAIAYWCLTFTALQGVCPSVRPSVCRTRGLWQNRKKDLSRFLYRTKDDL